MIKLHLPYAPSGWDLYNDWGKTAARPHPVRSGGTPPPTHQGLKQANCQPSLCFRRQNMRQHLTNAQKGFSTAFSTTASSRTTLSADA